MLKAKFVAKGRVWLPGWYQLELGDGIDPAYLPYDTMSGMIHVGFSFDFESEYCDTQEEIAPQPELGGSAPRRNR